MPSVERLWDKYQDGSCLIVGSGPSLELCDIVRVSANFDYTIVLNQAWRNIGCGFDMLLTIHPHEEEVIPGSPDAFCDRHKCVIATKRKGKTGWASELRTDSFPRVYVFTTNKDPHDFSNVLRASGEVYAGRGIQATAMSVAAHMGFKQLYLVGCDMCSLSGNHHAKEDHHIRTHGLSVTQIYREYYECSFVVRQKIKSVYGVSVCTISPFLGLGNEREDYVHQIGYEKIPRPVPDTSAYTRDQDFFL